MDRLSILREFLGKDELGIEIGPWFAPVVPKREGFRALSLDRFDGAALRERAAADPGIPRDALANIEEVDLIGGAADLEALVAARGLTGRIDYVVSSHNFEHLPNPIQFLQACERVLKPGGRVVMAIPDRRCCFDYFRGHSPTADLLAAFFEQRDRPTPAQVFSETSLTARWRSEGGDLHAFSLAEGREGIVPVGELDAAFRQWRAFAAAPDDTYRDVHCWTFTPASFELILRELRFVGLTGLAVEDVAGPLGCEFFVRLANRPDAAAPAREEFLAERTRLLHGVYREAGTADPDSDALKARIAVLEAELARRDEERAAGRPAANPWTAPGRALARRLLRRA